MTARRWSARLRPDFGACSYGAAGISIGVALDRDPERVVELQLSPADARLLAARLAVWADSVENEHRPKWEAILHKVDKPYFPDVWSRGTAD